MPELNALERQIFIELLDECANYLGRKICNDLEIPNTPEGQELFRALEEYANRDDPNFDVREVHKQSRLIHYNFIVFSYLRNKLNLKK